MVLQFQRRRVKEMFTKGSLSMLAENPLRLKNNITEKNQTVGMIVGSYSIVNQKLH